eukprot:CAMPEP_0182923568 /NCGR_PEP_ID=MMETSP0105_2-20130417/5514_1 /TAXON_ID=81532 ORGANISM="Acanthoeca-like sp., Strain 10tr" /NCGR_SAMPLE_ID=MMETSP0105_2 /ASSEMBLY_ACC=CAM_ASM_000205 /LENGTH=554 /DNA_ID=CAMNT_0025061295 /DNA_START=292 /DNA_END=1952 /DNA_ORIENTATION=+
MSPFTHAAAVSPSGPQLMEHGAGPAHLSVGVALTSVAVAVVLVLLCAKKGRKRRDTVLNDTLRSRETSVRSSTNPNVVWDDPLPQKPNTDAAPSRGRSAGTANGVASPAGPRDEKGKKRKKKGGTGSKAVTVSNETFGFGDGNELPNDNTRERKSSSKKSKVQDDDEAFDGFDDADAEDGATVPAWYAGKLSRDICEETVLAASRGDFLVRESSHGDRCVICINIGGKVMNLMVVSKDGKYRFAGKNRDGLEEVVFFLRLKPLNLKNGPCRVAKAAPGLREAQERDRLRRETESYAAVDTYCDVESARKLEFVQGSVPAASAAAESNGELVITAEDLYDAVDMDDFEEEPLYVDMFDANIPSSEWIAREEERHRMAMAGSQRLSNEEFGHLRIQARERAETAARENRRLANIARQKSVIRKAWRKSSAVPELQKSSAIHEEAQSENFFDYQNASLREFGGYQEEEIYDSVPTWFVGKLDRETADKAVKSGGPGTYLVRESSSGDKYIICINWDGHVKNFQIYITGDGYKFSGQTHAELQTLISALQKQGISKNG